jgi:hypothetical protein
MPVGNVSQRDGAPAARYPKRPSLEIGSCHRFPRAFEIGDSYRFPDERAALSPGQG